jgi:Na+/melibiose symporter-like transporter
MSPVVPTSQPQEFDIPGDSCCSKFLTYVPLIGLIYLIDVDYRLGRQIALTRVLTQDPKRLVELLKVQNHHCIAGSANLLLFTAMLVAILAKCVLPGAIFFYIAFSILTVLNVVTCVCRVHKNIKLLNELQTTGYRRDMEFLIPDRPNYFEMRWR